MESTKKTNRTFFGQPWGLVSLFATETWERFSYYGMRAILLYFMYYSLKQGGLGIDEGTAASIMAIYGSLVYFTGVFGGYISDRILGHYRSVFWGGVLIMFGHIVLALPLGKAALFTSMFLIIVGTGLLKPNISAMVGSLYSDKDTRRDAGFSIFYFGINLGAFVSPYLVGLAPQHFSFHVGFSFAALGMFIGLVIFVSQKKYQSESVMKPVNPLERDEWHSLILKTVIGIVALLAIALIAFATDNLNINSIIYFISIVVMIVPILYIGAIIGSRKISPIERSRVWAYIPIFIAGAIFWSIEEQGSVILASFADKRTYYPDWFSPAWFQMLNPLFIMLYTPIFAWLWTKLGNKQPSAPTKFAIGLVLAGASFMLMAIPSMLYGTDVKVSPMWLVMSWVLCIAGEMFISPIGLSTTTKLAPKMYVSEMLAVWFLSNSLGQGVNAIIVKFYTAQTETNYFLISGGIAVLGGIILSFFIPKIKTLMHGIR